MENERYIKDQILKCCGECDHHRSNGVCVRYADVSAFVRLDGRFMCPSQGIPGDGDNETGKVRIGQQKQRKR